MAIIRRGESERIHVTLQPVAKKNGKTVKGQSYGFTIYDLSLEEVKKRIRELLEPEVPQRS